jgi:hypothetical protein
VVVEEHRDVPRPRVVHGAEPPEQEVRDARRLVPEATVRPAPLVLHQEDLPARNRMLGARLDLRADGEVGVKKQRFVGHVVSPGCGLRAAGPAVLLLSKDHGRGERAGDGRVGVGA